MPPPRRLSIPLRSLTLPKLGIPSLDANVPLFVFTSLGKFTAIDFRLDPGAHLTEVDADLARAFQVPFGGPRLTLSVTSGAGTASSSGWIGSIRVRLPMWSGVEFDWPCFFRDSRPPNLPPQLGMAGVLSDLRLTLDATPAPGAADGLLILEARAPGALSSGSGK